MFGTNLSGMNAIAGVSSAQFWNFPPNWSVLFDGEPHVMFSFFSCFTGLQIPSTYTLPYFEICTQGKTTLSFVISKSLFIIFCFS